MTSQTPDVEANDPPPVIPLPPFATLVAMLQLALDALRSKLEPGQEEEALIKIKLYPFFWRLTYQFQHLNPGIIVWFLRGLDLIRRLPNGRSRCWLVQRQGDIDPVRLQERIDAGKVPRQTPGR